MSKKQFKRRTLFDLYSGNLEIHRPSLKGRFLCPICLAEFSKAALDADNPLVDLAHVLPKSIGGSVVTLECRDCNNRLGARYDSHRIMERKDREWASGSIPKRAVMKLGGDRIAVDWLRTDDGPHFTIREGQFRPGVDKDLLGLLAHKGSVEVQARFANPRSVAASSVHTAMLFMFWRFGYEWILESNADQIRQGLRDGPRRFDFRKIVGHVKSHDGALDNTTVALNIRSDSADKRCFIVTVPSERPEVVMHVVILPGFGAEGLECFERAIEIAAEVRPWKGRGFLISDSPEVLLREPGAASSARDIWNKFR